MALRLYRQEGSAGHEVAGAGGGLRMVDLDTLVERCRQGDDLAWEALVRSYQGRVYGLSFHYLRDPELARDTAQEVFVRVYRRLATLREGAAFVPWLMGVARHCAIDRLRRERSRRPATVVELAEAPEVADPGPTPEEATAGNARHRLLYRALGRLSDKNREIILLKDIQGLKLEEIADLLELPLGTVKSRSNRARVELAQAVRQLDPMF